MRAGAVPVRVFDPTKMTADNADAADTKGVYGIARDATAQAGVAPPNLSAYVYAMQAIHIIRVIRSESLPRARRGGPRPCFCPTKQTADNADAADTRAVYCDRSERNRSSKRGTPDPGACSHATKAISIIRVIRAIRGPRPRFA